MSSLDLDLALAELKIVQNELHDLQTKLATLPLNDPHWDKKRQAIRAQIGWYRQLVDRSRAKVVARLHYGTNRLVLSS